MTDKANGVKSVPERTDEEALTAINGRYFGRMDRGQLNFEEPDTRAQLALDLGFLIGMCARLLDATGKKGG